MHILNPTRQPPPLPAVRGLLLEARKGDGPQYMASVAEGVLAAKGKDVSWCFLWVWWVGVGGGGEVGWGVRGKADLTCCCCSSW